MAEKPEAVEFVARPRRRDRDRRCGRAISLIEEVVDGEGVKSAMFCPALLRGFFVKWVWLDCADGTNEIAAPMRLINAFGAAMRIDCKVVVTVHVDGVVRATSETDATGNALFCDSARHAKKSPDQETKTRTRIQVESGRSDRFHSGASNVRKPPGRGAGWLCRPR